MKYNRVDFSNINMIAARKKTPVGCSTQTLTRCLSFLDFNIVHCCTPQGVFLFHCMNSQRGVQSKVCRNFVKYIELLKLEICYLNPNQ